MTAKPVRTALVYDFDGTLAPGNMQEHSFLPSLGVSATDFWKDVKERAERHNADEILVYMWRMLEVAREKGIPVTKELLAQHGATLQLFPGVPTWFERINAYGASRQLAVEHYIISSGIYELIRGCSIWGAFTYVFASKFIYEGTGAVWPGAAINYTSKMQHLFRINKGIANVWDNALINRWIPEDERPIPFSQIVFIGDGETDVPAMKTVRSKGGHSVAVYDSEKITQERAQGVLYNLIAEDRVDFVAPADYSEGSLLDITVKGVLGRVARAAGYRES